MLGLCRRRACCLPLIIAANAVLVGCEPEPVGHQPVAGGAVPAAALETPEDSARSALLCLQAHLRAIARRDEQAAQECLAQMRTLIAIASIEQTLARRPQFKTMLGDDLIEGHVNNWGAAMAYYAGVASDDEGFHFEQMRRASEAPQKVAVVVPASGPKDDALIQVTCLREDDGLWRVSRIEFIADTPPVSRPASQPASQPS